MESNSLVEGRTRPLVDELKTRARLAIGGLRRDDPAMSARLLKLLKKARRRPPSTWKLAHTLDLAAVDSGFSDFQHAAHVLGGSAEEGADLGGFWYDSRCGGLLNHWFATHAEARAFCREHPGRVLVPYRRQFVVGDADYVRALGLDPADPAFAAAAHDLVTSYGGPAWYSLCAARLRATRWG